MSPEAPSTIQPVSAIAAITAYRVPPAGPPVDLRLDGNEGAVPPAELLSSIPTLGPELLRRYPNNGPLTHQLATRLGVASESVLVTAGADDALDRICRAFLGPGRQLILPEPTFEMLPRYARLAQADIVSIPWPTSRYPLEEVLRSITPATKVIAVVSPNNPTGANISASELRQLSEGAPDALLLVDLAYNEFADEDLTRTALSLPNAVITGTLSKAWGFAGLRVGYAAGPARLISSMRVVGVPYAVSSLSLALAARWLEQGSDAVDTFVVRIKRERSLLFQLLEQLGAKPMPSQANFILARFHNAPWVWQGLAGLGIAVRAFPGNAALEGCLRITCPGEEQSFERVSHALHAVLRPQALLFDLDGVLADVSESYRAAIIATASSFGVALGHDAIAAAKAQGNANNDWELTRRLLAEQGVSSSLAEVTERFELCYQGCTSEPGLWRKEKLLCELGHLERLAQRFPLAIVTGRPRMDAERFLQETGIRSLFQVVVTMEDAPLKPDPAPVLRALEHLGVRHAWMLGDTPDDIRAARAAGVVPIGLLSPTDARTQKEAMSNSLTQAGAARILPHVQALEELLS